MAQVAELYEEHEGKPFFTALCKHMSSGPLVALVLEKANAISEWLELLGPEDAMIARAEVSIYASALPELGSRRPATLLLR